MQTIHRWGVFELALRGPSDGNPFEDVRFGARFERGGRSLAPEGFYDGDGVYRVRFMPDEVGEWRYVTSASAPNLDGVTGSFTCVPPPTGSRGPVRVCDTFHFAYADGARYVPVGTTCYAWVHQGEMLENLTLATLRGAPFNKLRMCVFPKHYPFNTSEPTEHPFAPNPGGGRDFTSPNPAFFRRLERRVGELAALGIEADLILFHPYDRWGYADMGAERDDRYLRYVVARLAAYHNVWWSLANEYDAMPAKSADDWDRLFQVVERHDPYGHLRSIHNWVMLGAHTWETFYDHTKPWVTHCSVQHAHMDLVPAWRAQYQKPVVADEVCYEGDIPEGWGNISGRELVHRLWQAAARGGYAGHGETFRHPEDILWWSKGGTLRGESPPRIAFLRHVLEGARGALDPVRGVSSDMFPVAGVGDSYFLMYFGAHQPGAMWLRLPGTARFAAEVLDTWEMTATSAGVVSGACEVALPARPYLALRLWRIEE